MAIISIMIVIIMDKSTPTLFIVPPLSILSILSTLSPSSHLPHHSILPPHLYSHPVHLPSPLFPHSTTHSLTPPPLPMLPSLFFPQPSPSHPVHPPTPIHSQPLIFTPVHPSTRPPYISICPYHSSTPQFSPISTEYMMKFFFKLIINHFSTCTFLEEFLQCL